VSRREKLWWVGLIVGALALRLILLGARPPHHDESVHAHFAHILLTSGAYQYDPTYHGPLLYYITAAIFGVLGEGLLTLRLYPAVAGTLLVALPLGLRRRLGSRGAWWSGFLVAISPSYLYYSRFARNDVPVALFTAAACVLFLQVRRGRWRALPWVGVMAALHAISKETFFVTAPLVAAGAAGVALRLGVRSSVGRTSRWLRRNAVPLTTAVLLFVVITVVAYTFVFIHPQDAVFPLKAIRYWYEQHKIQRVGGPWFYHLPRLALYEFLILGAALVWAFRRRGRLHPLEVFCLFWGLAGLGMYSFLGEKVPWLEVHQLLPFIPLAGMQLGRTFSSKGRAWSRSLAALGIAATAWSATAVTYLHPSITTSDPHAELLVFVQTTPEEGKLAAEGKRLAKSFKGRQVAAVTGEGSWPLSWQWENLDVWWALPRAGSSPLLVVCDPAQEGDVRRTVGEKYSESTIPLRGWWVEEWKGVTPWKVAKWFFTRRAWSPLGATDVMVFRAQEVAGP
jgi:uncharacterized protein (TIGR03663 family)